jgi:hypothetical protein
MKMTMHQLRKMLELVDTEMHDFVDAAHRGSYTIPSDYLKTLEAANAATCKALRLMDSFLK